MLLRFSLAIALLAALLGCRTDPYVNAHIESLNSEYRQLEDQVYMLTEEKRQLTGDLARLEDENRRLRGGEPAPTRRGLRSRSGSNDSAEIEPPLIEMGTEVGPSIEMPGIPSAVDPPVQRTPRSRGVPEPTTPRSLEPPAPRRSGRMNLEPRADEAPDAVDEDAAPRPAPQIDPAPGELPAPPGTEIKEQTEPEPIDGRVTHIFLNPLLTGGDDFDRQPGDDGLSILLEPRNKKNQYVAQAGVVSVVVLDPAKKGDAARVARWDFDLATTRQKMQKVSPTRGIHLQMPWPATTPDNNRLRMFVRYETADGRKLQADREIFVTLPGQFSHRWTPRPPNRPRRASDAPPVAASEVVQHPPAPQPVAQVAPPAAQPTAQPAVKHDDQRLTAAPPAVAENAPLSAQAPQSAAAEAPKASTPVEPPRRSAEATAKRERPQWKPFR